MAVGELHIAPDNHQHPFPPDLRMQVPTLNDRNSISEYIRWEGMQVYVVLDQKWYGLKGGISNSDWVEMLGGTGGGSGTPPVAGSYPSINALINAQPDQLANYLYFAAGAYYEYTGGTTGTIGDYRLIGGGTIMPNGVVNVGSATINDSSVDLDNQWKWSYSGIVYQKNTPTNIPIPSVDTGNFRLD